VLGLRALVVLAKNTACPLGGAASRVWLESAREARENAHIMSGESPSFEGLRGRCLDCGYPLRGLAAHRCPEYGREFDPLRYSTMDFSRAGPFERMLRRWWIRCCLSQDMNCDRQGPQSSPQSKARR